METPRTHLTALPPGFITVRILQVIFTVAIVAISAFIMSVNGDFATFIVLISAAVTLIILVWMILATYLTPRAYNYWAILAFEIFLFLVWLDGFIFALGASFSSQPYIDCPSVYSYVTHTYTRDCDDIDDNLVTVVVPALAASVAAFGACELILWLVSMIVVSVFIARHRDAGGHCKFGSPAPVPRTRDPLMAVSQMELQQQNIALQQQYLSLQQQHLDLQRANGLAVPGMARMSYGQANVAKGADLESGNAPPAGWYAQPYQGYAQPYPQMHQVDQPPQAVSPMSSIAEGSGQQFHRPHQQQQAPEVAQVPGSKGKARDPDADDEPVMSGAHRDEGNDGPIVR